MGINIQQLNFSYQKSSYILKNINLKIDSKNEFITIIGSSGSGKSTLIQIFNGLLKTNEGLVNVYDVKINDKTNNLKRIRKKVGLVFQFPEHQLFLDTVLKDVSYGPKNFSIKNYKEQAINALNMVKLDESYYDLNPFNLSGGEQRKVAIAGVLASNPDIIILDEPTVGLDYESKIDLLNLLINLNKEYHKSIIIVTHDMDLVGKYAKRVVVLENGNIIFDGNKFDLFKNNDIMKNYSLDYPNQVLILKKIKEKFNNEKIDEFKYDINDVYNEIKRVYNE